MSQGDERCPRCDRAECNIGRVGLNSPETRGDSRCFSLVVDWRERALSAERDLAESDRLNNECVAAINNSLEAAERERVVAAAIFHRGVIFSAPPPARHHTVAHAMSEMGISLETQGGIDPHRVQGFVTSTGRFVEREAACAIARAAGQIKVKTGPDHILFSEDVW